MASSAGRRSIAHALARIPRHEFWSGAVFYAPLVPWLAWLSLRHRGTLVFTCANPGIECGGGTVGESKFAILRALERAAAETLPASLISAKGSPAARAERVLEFVRAHPRIGELPIILKPDQGRRGWGVRLARTSADVLDYLDRSPMPVIAQAYHPGPLECGVMWVRQPDGPVDGRVGRIFSITRKEFPLLIGDGRTTLEGLITFHPRYRHQADVFLVRFASLRDRVLAPGETLRLSEAGNHAQGAIFRDGSDLASDALEARIDAIAAGYRDARGGEVDFGRFDLRYETDEALRQGRGFGIVELNGVSSESTNLYDPDQTLWWAYGVLYRQWALLYELGAMRRSLGARPMSVPDLLRALRDDFRSRPRSPVSD
jgi:hypothetical protein